MKKIKWIIIALIAGIGLTGCSGSKALGPEQATESCVYIDEKGRISSVLLTQYEEADEDLEGLKSFAEDAVIEYNKKNGAAAMSQNVEEALMRLPVAIRDCRMEKGTASVIFEYATADDLIEFSAEQQDSTVGLTGLETGTVADGLLQGKIIDGTFISAKNGGEVSAGTVTKKNSNMLVTVYGTGTIRTAKKIVYMTQGVSSVDDYTVKTPQGKSYIIFKE